MPDAGARVPTRLRLAEPAAGAALAAIYRPAVADSAVSFELEPPDGAEMVRRVARVLARTPWLVCEAAGEVVGYAYAGPHRARPAYRWSVEVSAYVRGDARRAGVARALYASLFALLGAQGFRTAYAGITLPNAASEGLHAALGFAPVGVYRGVGYKLGAWHDVAWFARPLAPLVAEPAAPVPVPDLVGTAALEEALAVGLPRLRPPLA